MNNWYNPIGLLIGIIGVVAFRELPEGWHLLMWIPISIGFAVWNLKNETKM